MTSYHRACDVAYNLCPPFATDIVHDAFLAWQQKHNTNLFDESDETIGRVLKKVYSKRYYKKYASRVARMKEAITLVTPEDEYIEQEVGLRFVEYDEIRQQIEEYTIYHTKFPKLHEN